MLNPSSGLPLCSECRGVILRYLYSRYYTNFLPNIVGVWCPTNRPAMKDIQPCIHQGRHGYKTAKVKKPGHLHSNPIFLSSNTESDTRPFSRRRRKKSAGYLRKPTTNNNRQDHRPNQHPISGPRTGTRRRGARSGRPRPRPGPRRRG